MNYSIMTTFSAILSRATYPMFKSFIHEYSLQGIRYLCIQHCAVHVCNYIPSISLHKAAYIVCISLNKSIL